MSKIEILKDSDPKKIAQWERVHDKRKHYRCERCGAEWKCEYFDKKIAQWERAHDKRKHYRCERCGAEWRCEYFDNKFGSIQDYNGDPDILCQLCGKPTVKEVIMREVPESLKGVTL